jgi:hypothetical protein
MVDIKKGKVLEQVYSDVDKYYSQQETELLNSMGSKKKHYQSYNSTKDMQALLGQETAAGADETGKATEALKTKANAQLVARMSNCTGYKDVYLESHGSEYLAASFRALENRRPGESFQEIADRMGERFIFRDEKGNVDEALCQDFIDDQKSLMVMRQYAESRCGTLDVTHGTTASAMRGATDMALIMHQGKHDAKQYYSQQQHNESIVRSSLNHVTSNQMVKDTSEAIQRIIDSTGGSGTCYTEKAGHFNGREMMDIIGQVNEATGEYEGLLNAGSFNNPDLANKARKAFDTAAILHLQGKLRAPDGSLIRKEDTYTFNLYYGSLDTLAKTLSEGAQSKRLAQNAGQRAGRAESALDDKMQLISNFNPRKPKTD